MIFIIAIATWIRAPWFAGVREHPQTVLALLLVSRFKIPTSKPPTEEALRLIALTMVRTSEPRAMCGADTPPHSALRRVRLRRTHHDVGEEGAEAGTGLVPGVNADTMTCYGPLSHMHTRR